MPRPSRGTLFKRGDTWWLEYYANGQRERQSLGTGNRERAEAERARIMAPLTVGRAADKAKALADRAAGLQADAARVTADAAARAEAERPRLAVVDAWSTFKADKTRPPSSKVTLEDYAARWAWFTRWWAENRPGKPNLEDVTRDDASAFVAHLEGASLSPNRRNKACQTARLVFNVLAPQLAGKPNPFGATARAGIKNLPLETVSRRALSEGELRAVCGAATGELRPLLALGIYGGLRLGDACLLRWEAVDLLARRLVVTPAKTRRRLAKKIVLPLHPVLAAILAETPPPARRDDVLPDLAATYRRDPAAVSKRVRDLFEAAGIQTQDAPAAEAEDGADAEAQDDPERKRRRSIAGFHALRHSFVSLAAVAGVPQAVVQALVGHATAAMTEVYTHVPEAATRAAIAALPDVTVPEPPKALPAPAAPAVASDSELRAAIRAVLALDLAPGEQLARIAALVG